MKFVLIALVSLVLMTYSALAAPLTFVFQKQKDPSQVKAHAEKIASLLSKAVGEEIKVVVPRSYAASVEAVVSNQAQLAYVSSVPYLLAKKEAPVEILAVEVRSEKTSYDSIWVVRKDSPFQQLADLKSKRLAFTSPTSTSGYLFPLAHLVEQKLIPSPQKLDTFFSRTHFAGAYDLALRAVLNDQSDVAVVSDYTMEGKTADKYLRPEERAKLRILHRQPGVPTHLIMARSDLGKERLEAIQKNLLALAKQEPTLFADVYGASSFQVSGHEHVKTAERALQKSGLQLSGFVN